MRLLVFAFMAAVAGFMGWMWLQPVCNGGAVVADEAACARVAGFDDTFCRAAFRRTEDIARTSGATYPTLWECNQNWPKCMERGPTGEAVPVPSGWCIVRGPAGALAKLQPQYDNRRQ
jgi:hypothetical protein